MAKKKFDYETLEVGEDLGTKEIVITEDVLRSYVSAIEDEHPWYLESSPFGRPIVPSTVFDEEVLRMLDAKYERFGSIHAKQDWEFKSPAFVGERLKIKTRIADKYIKRERGWMVLQLDVLGEDGREICHAKHYSVVSLKERHKQ